MPTAQQIETLNVKEESSTSTSASKWRENGEQDPHGERYNQERSSLTLGNFTDDELANGAFMNYDQVPQIMQLIATGPDKRYMPILWMTAVKDRIRWLSRSLVRETERNATLKSTIGELQSALEVSSRKIVEISRKNNET